MRYTRAGLSLGYGQDRRSEMNIISKLWFLTGSVLVFCLFILGCQKEVGANTTAPDFSLMDLSGRTVSMNQFRGKIVLLDFWATWCPPCRMSIPELIKIEKKYGEKGLVILAVSLDHPRQLTDSNLVAFKEKNGINYRVLRFNPKIIQDYFGPQSPSIPTQFIIDRKGKIINRLVGFSPGTLEKHLDELF